MDRIPFCFFFFFFFFTTANSGSDHQIPNSFLRKSLLDMPVLAAFAVGADDSTSGVAADLTGTSIRTLAVVLADRTCERGTNATGATRLSKQIFTSGIVVQLQLNGRYVFLFGT
jgi:hypothetical protein